MAIDDLADRTHDVDLLLDQNIGRAKADYADLVPTSARSFIGPEYALLRPEFARLRDYSIKRRQDFRLRKIVVSLGGVDRENHTSSVLNALVEASLPCDVEVTLVLGGQAPGLDFVRAQSAQVPFTCQVRVDVTEMAQLMADADIVIGAAGSSMWERCALGIPSIVLVTADNQREAAAAIKRSDSAIVIDASEVEVLPGAINELLSNAVLAERLSVKSAKLTTGSGAAILAEAMEGMAWPLS
jgi:UDP-2,4-diacetamido-2,4,6-trideoxy-beta-L-altropyranose hydrolase